LFAFAVPNVIRIKKSNVTTVVPTGLLEGELAANIADQKLWIGNSSQNSILISDYPQRLWWDGGSAGLTAATGRTSLGATTVGSNLFTLTNPTAVTFPRFNLDNTVTALNAADFRTAIGAGTSSTTGTVTSVAITVPTGLSVSGTPITSTGTLAVTLTTGYSIPTTAKQTNWDTAYTQTQQWSGGSTNLVAATARTSLGLVIGTNVQAWDADLDAIAALAGTSGLLKKTAANTWSLDTASYSTTTGTVTSVAAVTLGTTGTDLSSTVATGTTTPVITLNVPTASATNRGALSSADWSNFNTAYTNRITSLTVTGASGAATLTTNTLNIPTYTLSGLGGIKLTDLSSTATGLTYTNTTGVFSLTAGYSIPTTTKQGNWDTAYSSYLQWDGGATSLVAATARTSLGLVIGTNVQAWDGDLDAIAAIVGTTGLLKKTAANTWSLDTTAYTANTGTVTSVSASVPTGLSISGSPITSSGTLAITLTAGYSIPTTSSQGNWDTAYTNRITSLTVTGSSGAATLTTNTLNIPTYTLAGLGGQASSANLTSVAGLTYVSASFVKMTASGTFSLDTTAYTANVGTVTSVAALTLGTTGTDLSSTVATGTVTPVITLNVPTASATNRGALSSTDWSNFNTAYTNRISSLTVTGSSGAATLTSNVLNIPTYTLSGLGGIKLTDLSSSATGLTYTNTTGVFSLTTGYSIPTTAKQGNWDTAYSSYLQWDGGSTSLVAATGRTSLGATTVGGNMFTLTNPSAVTFPRFNLDNTVTALDAATFRGAIGAGTSSTTGTVTSVAITVPTGLSVSGTPITSTGTLAVTLTTGYSIPTTASQGNWDTAYSNRITSLTTTGTGAATLTSNVLNIPTATFTSLTVTGSSGASTLSAGVLNVPTYTLSGLGGQASSASLTSLAGLTYVSASFVKMTAAGTFALDTTAYTANTGTVTSIATTSPITGGTITGSGTIGINASSDNTASYVVQRDASGNFAAGIITANLFGIATSATNILGGNPGQIPYITWEGSTGFTPTGIKGQALTSNGTAPPTWSSAPPAASSIFLANNFGGL
jgi:hypothetical protein